MLSSKISSKIPNRPKSLSGVGLRHFVPTIIIALAMFFASNISSKAQCSCPSGYTTYSFSYTVPGPNCNITVYYCQNCAPTGHSDVRLCNILVPYGCNFQLTNAFWMNLKIAAIAHAAATCSFGIPPCTGLPRQQYTLFTGECKKLVYDDFLEEVTIEDCDEDPGTCEGTYDVCYNSSTGQYEVNFTGNNVIDEGDCGPAFPYIDPENQFTDCFTTCQ